LGRCIDHNVGIGRTKMTQSESTVKMFVAALLSV
jgi:hypothetical protein